MTNDSIVYHRLDSPEELYEGHTPLLRNILYLLILCVIAASGLVIYKAKLDASNAMCQMSQIYEISDMQKEIIRLKSIISSDQMAANHAQQVPKLHKRREVADINCKRIFDGDTEYTKNFAGHGRRKLISTMNLDMSCNAIRERFLPARNPREGFSIAYAKVVHEDYEFLEEQLAMTYSEENWYCFAPDLMASAEFHRRFMQLAMCLPNVILAAKEYETDSAGHYHTNAFLDCLSHLKAKAWNYIIFLQNNDIIIKSNREIVTILKTLNGANDMELMRCPNDGRCDDLETNLGKLDLCPKDSLVDRTTCGNKNLTWAKGSVQATLSRKTADFITNNVDYQPLQDELNKNSYGIDEVFLQTLMITKELGIPGHFPSRCLISDPVSVNEHIFMTRLTHWGWLDWICGSNYWRHKICVFGIEDIQYLAGVDYIMANKMMPEFDYGAISCIGELLYNRTWLGQDDHPLNITVYANLPLVRLHKLEQSHPTNASEIFQCPTI